MHVNGFADPPRASGRNLLISRHRSRECAVVLTRYSEEPDLPSALQQQDRDPDVLKGDQPIGVRSADGARYADGVGLYR